MEEKFSIQPYLNDLHLLNETVKQIQKDFSFFSVEITFSGNKNTAYDELLSQIQPVIKKLADEDYQKLLSLLYRVDINEEQLKTAGEITRHISDLVIKRCLQKVVLRKLFSK